MKIVFDARWIGSTPSGVGVYSAELLRRLPTLAPRWQWHLLFQSETLCRDVTQACRLADKTNVTTEILPYGVFSPEGQFRLPNRLNALAPDLYFTANYMMPYRAFPQPKRGKGPKCVATIHDVIPLLLKKHAPRSRKSRMLPVFRWCLRQSIRRADMVLTVSEASRRDMIRALKLPPAQSARIRVVYNGVDERFRPPDKSIVSATSTLLYVGRLDPYKNVVTLIRAFDILHRQQGGNMQLLIVGPEDERYPEARRMVSALGLEANVSFLGFLANDDLVSAYQEATMVVNPSSYEGFGLSLVEAMRSGIPVVCGNGGAQPEIAGKAALVVPAGDTHALADAMGRVLSDPRLRQRLIERGLSRAADFSWDRTAAQTMACFREILESAPTP